jgi:hypothetical protein
MLQLAQLQAEVLAKQAMMGTLCDQLTAAQQQLTDFDSHSDGALAALQRQLADSAEASSLLNQQLAEAETAKAGLQQQLIALQEQLHAAAHHEGQGGPLQVETGDLSHLDLPSKSPARANSSDPAGSRAQLAEQVGGWTWVDHVGQTAVVARQLWSVSIAFPTRLITVRICKSTATIICLAFPA